MVLPPIREEVSSHLSAREIKRIARAVNTANFPQSLKVGVNSIFVSKDLEEDPRVEGFKEDPHKYYDGLVLRQTCPP